MRFCALLPAAILLAMISLLVGCIPYHRTNIWKRTASDRQIRRCFAEEDTKPSIFYFRSGNHSLRGWQVGADSLPVTLLVHGAPSSMFKFNAWFADPTFYGKTRLVAVDRPGYGGSGYGRAVVSIEQQAKILAPLLKELSKNGPITLYGSSYGGAVVAKLAMDHPDQVRALLLQSASVEPNAEWTPKIAYWIKSPLGWAFPRWARVATKEKFNHQRALGCIQNDWDRITCPVWILHGQADKLIYPSNAEYAYEQLSPHTDVTFIKLDNLGHRLYYERRDTLRHYILEALDCTQPAVLLPLPATLDHSTH